MTDFLISVLDKTAPDRVPRARLVNLMAWDGDLSPDDKKLSRVGALVEDLIKWGRLKPHVVQIEHSSQDTYRFPDALGVDGWSKASWGNDRFRWFDNKAGRWKETRPVGRGEARPINELPQGAEPITWKTEEEWFRVQDVARCLRELGDKGAHLRSEGLALWLRQHGEVLKAVKDSNALPKGFEGDRVVKWSDVVKECENYGGKMTTIEAKRKHLNENPWLQATMRGTGEFWLRATLDALANHKDDLLPGYRMKEPAPALKVV